jgi:cytochrome c oxidase cbb3-type subunit 3
VKYAFFSSVLVLAALTGCGKSQGGSSSIPQALPSVQPAPVPLGQRAGTGDSPMALSTPNPYEGNKQAAAEGKALYIRLNCPTCHSYDGSGNQGPDLTDTYWRYGGLPVQIYNSIHDGRPKGMPSWGEKVSSDDIWKLVAYVESFGGSFPASDWQHAPQGDVQGENEAPEAQGQFMTPVPPPSTAKTPAAATHPR